MSLDVSRHLCTILDGVMGLLTERARRHVVRVAHGTSRHSLRAVCFELSDGTRLCQCPGGLTDATLEAAAVQWLELGEGEHIIEVKGWAADGRAGMGGAVEHRPSGKGRGRGPPPARASSPPLARAASPPSSPRDLAAGVVLCTNQNRLLELGVSAKSEPAFSFKAADDAQVENATFAGGTCTGIDTAPLAACWSSDVIAKVHVSLRAAAEALAPVLLRLSSRAGPEHVKNASLQVRRLGVELGCGSPHALGDLEKHASSTTPPGHWDLSAMPGSSSSGWLKGGAEVSKVYLNDGDVTSLQALLNATFSVKTSRQGGDRATARVPSGLELVWGLRLQNWRAWVSFVARQEAIREQFAAPFMEATTDKIRVKTAGTQPLGLELKQDETHCVWLFHFLDPKLADRATSSSFSVDSVSADDPRSHGMGIYLSENCRAVDELAADGTSGLRCMLLCRTLLGRSLVDETMMPDVAKLTSSCVGGCYHSVVADLEKHRPDEAHRSFVVYDVDQVYPEAVLWYRRTYN